MRFVVKIGSRVLAEDPTLRIEALASQVAQARRDGHTACIVTSGAIALGILRMQLGARPQDLPHLQAAAAVGQGMLMELYERAFSGHGLHVGQVLLTHEDVRDDVRTANAKRTLTTLLEMGAVPVVNENDTVAVEEIKFGDNDRLAALVANLIEASLLILLTDVQGLLDSEGRVVPLVRDVSSVAKMAGGAGDFGTGGMASKVESARLAAQSGIETVVASGRNADVLTRLFRGESVGTRFVLSGGSGS